MTGGIAPNAGRIRRSISAGLESVSESAARVTKREAADVAGTPNVSRTEPNDIKSDGNSSNVDPEAPSSSGNADAPRSPQVGDKVTRHWGGKSGPDGESWTRDPASAQTRENLGLGRSNTGEFVSEGTLVDATGTTSKKADSWDGFGGGGDEVLVPDPQKQIRLDSVRMPDEPLPDR